MIQAIFLLTTVIAIYVACAKPEWLWTVWIASSMPFDVLTRIQHNFDQNGAALGSIAVRPNDGPILAILIGIVYHGRREGFGDFFRKPGGRILLALWGFVVLKSLASVLLFSDAIAQNRMASHAAGGLVAVIGEVRDNITFLIPPIYAYGVRKSRDLEALGWPFMVVYLVLLATWVVGLAAGGSIWTGANNPFGRPVNAYGAVHLTQFGFILLFLRVPGLNPGLTRSLACFGILIATLANHRSQWLALAAGGGSLLLIMLLGRPIFRSIKLGRVMAAGAVLAVVGCFSVLTYLSDLGVRFPILEQISIRLYAVTNPGRDADAQWREALWHDRIQQVGNNWPWGRPLGARVETLRHGTWIAAPAHSAYVSAYEVGGVILCVLMAAYFLTMLSLAFRLLVIERDPDHLWPAAVSVAIIASDLAFGGAYSLPPLSPALIVVLLVSSSKTLSSTSSQFDRQQIRAVVSHRNKLKQKPLLT